MANDASKWDEFHKRLHVEGQHTPSVYAKEKEKLFPRRAIVIDLGGGTGADTLYFLEKGHSVVLMDISSFALSITQTEASKRRLSKNLVVKQVDFGLHELPIKENSIDVAYSRIALNYFPADQTTKILHSIYKVLKPKAKAYITLKSPDDLQEMEYLEKTAAEYEPNVYIDGDSLRSRFTKDQLTKMLTLAGIQDFEVNPLKEPLGTADGSPLQLIVNEIVFQKP